MDIDRHGLLRQVREILALLAADGPTALAGEPDGTDRPSELALDYDNVCLAALGNFRHEMPEDLAAALRRTLDRFDDVTRDLWTEEAVCDHPVWQAIRDSAGDTLTRFDRWQSTASGRQDGT